MAYLDFGLTQSVSDVDPTLPLILPSETESSPTEFVPQLPSADELGDPLVRFPLKAGGQVIAVGILQLAATGLGDLVDPGQSDRGITDRFVIDETVIGAGDIDVGRAAESLRSGTDGAFGEVRFTSTGDHDGYTLYESDLEDSVVVALGEDAVDAPVSVERSVDVTEPGDQHVIVGLGTESGSVGVFVEVIDEFSDLEETTITPEDG
ncbi:Glycosyl hydrolases family 32 (levanase/invertase) [Halapricum desulfuricans]|uniref:Glycosyl hydrolases family 32 (Levanase/invertase) n=2 Tax=Halapricum desulfuricans TaxID=2841257 RepID=A0A897NNP5_9EURY|nr:Glycosyl hydrolases family 32 (levanase/invertase) [Halapricum desulfuricans]